jgi:histone-lysine N-methyltransferase MLL3
MCRSKIQGLGLYAARDLERHTMVIEYIGEIIRTELAELREKQYEARVSNLLEYLRVMILM